MALGAPFLPSARFPPPSVEGPQPREPVNPEPLKAKPASGQPPPGCRHVGFYKQHQLGTGVSSLLSLPCLRPGPGRPARGLWSSAAERVSSPCLCLMVRPQAAPRWPLEVHVLHSQDGAFPAPAILPSGPRPRREGGGHRPGPHQAACPRRTVGSSEATWSPWWFSWRAGPGQAGHRQDRARDPEVPSFQKVSERLYTWWRECGESSPLRGFVL